MSFRPSALGGWVAVVLLAAVPVSAEEPARSFERLCSEWTENLVTREQRNRADMQWEFSPTGVRGTYVGYSPLQSCELHDPSAEVPVGTLSYLEVHYEMQGWTVPEAAATVPKPLATTEVTEMFTYTGNSWNY